MGQSIRIASSVAQRALPRKLNFTETVVGGLKCPAGKDRVYVYDAKVPGLAVQVTSTGAKSYYFIGRVRGEVGMVRHRIAATSKLNVDNVRRAAMRINGDAADGINPRATVRAKREAAKTSRTLEEAWTDYRTKHLEPKKRGSTLRSDKSRWSTHLAVWASRTLANITAEDVAALHARITERAQANGKTGNAADKAVKLLRRIFTYHKISPNPAANAVQFHGDKERQRFLTREEATRLLAEVERSKYKKTADAIKLALFTGTRAGNICSAKWRDIHLDNGIWIIPEDQSKSRKPMTINLPPPAVALLKERKAEASPDAAYVFPGHVQGRPITTVAGAWRAARTRAKLTDVHLHDLRHTLASWMAMSGASLLVIGKQLGHASKQSTARYAHLDIEAVKGATTAALTTLLTNMPDADPTPQAPTAADERAAAVAVLAKRIGKLGNKAMVFRAAGMTRHTLNRILDGTYVPQQRSIDRLAAAIAALGL